MVNAMLNSGSLRLGEPISLMPSARRERSSYATILKPMSGSVKDRVTPRSPHAPAPDPSSGAGYAVAVVSVALALLATLQVELLATRTPFALFFAAVIVTAWYGGRNPGILAIAMSAVLSDYFIIPPRHSLSFRWDSIAQVSTFVFVALLINWLTTARQQVEDLLRDSEARLQTVIENLTEGLVISNLDGQMTQWNRAALELHGFKSMDECLVQLPAFQDVFELSSLDGSVLKPEQWPLARVISGEHLRNLEVRIRRVNSDWERIFSFGGTVVREPNGKQVAFVTITDITEHNRAAETLQVKNLELAEMTQQLWQASKLATMGELAASVAHELNNPLATISLRLESLASELAHDSKKSRSVAIVADEVERMGKLVGSLLEFSRRGHQQVSTINIGVEIAKAIELIEYYLRSRRIDVIQDLEADLPTNQADRQQLRQVFLNLLTNASDAMPSGGKLVVRTRNARGETGIKGVSIQFIDEGTGITPENLKKMWEPFFTTKHEGKGTGLGLAICQRVIEEHRGRISIESRLGEGSTVTIFLPSTTEEGA